MQDTENSSKELYKALNSVLQTGSSFGGKGRELAPWETLALGALAGSLASISTCPADVVKTRIMTHAVDKAVNPGQIIADIIQHEGVGECSLPPLPL